MDDTLKTIVTALGLAGGVIALAEKVLKAATWFGRGRRERREQEWATDVYNVFVFAEDPGLWKMLERLHRIRNLRKPFDATFFSVQRQGGQEYRCIVPARRERAAQWGVEQGHFLAERDPEGRLVVRRRVDLPLRDEALATAPGAAS